MTFCVLSECAHDWDISDAFDDFDRYAWSHSALENWIQQKEKQAEPCKNFQEKYK